MPKYAHPEVLVSTAWVDEHENDPNVRIVESDEDVLLYQQGHVPGAVRIDWHTDLQDPLETRLHRQDALRRPLRAQRNRPRYRRRLLRRQKQLVGLLRLLDLQALRPRRLPHHGRRTQTLGNGQPPLVARSRARLSPHRISGPRSRPSVRAFRDEMLRHCRAGKPLVDVRSPGEYTGELLHMPDYPQEGALRGGHIPGAVSIPWSRATNEDGTFRSAGELEKLYLKEQGLKRRSATIAYCRIGERSSHTWFVLKYLLGFQNVRNYDGSWTEWGNAVGLPVARGAEPGDAAEGLGKKWETPTRRAAQRNNPSAVAADTCTAQPCSRPISFSCEAVAVIDSATPAQRLDAIAAEFAELEPRERLELLLEYADNLPPLPAELQDEADRAAHRIAECQTPVFMWANVVDGRVRLGGRGRARGPHSQGIRQHFDRFVRRCAGRTSA